MLVLACQAIAAVTPHLCCVKFYVCVVDVCRQILALYSNRIGSEQPQDRDNSPPCKTSSPISVSDVTGLLWLKS